MSTNTQIGVCNSKNCLDFTTNQANIKGPALQALREGAGRHRKESQNFATAKKKPNKRAAEAELGQAAVAGNSRTSSRKIRRYPRQTGRFKNKVVFYYFDILI